MNDEINWTDEPPFHYNRCRVHAKSEAIMVTADTYFYPYREYKADTYNRLFSSCFERGELLSERLVYMLHGSEVSKIDFEQERQRIQAENQRKVNEADGLYREGLRLKAQNTEQSLQSAVEKFRAAARITVNSEYRALYQREEAAATAAIPAVREAGATRQCNEAIERYNTANNLSGQAQIDRRNEAIDALDRAIRLNPSNRVTYINHRATMVAQRDREVIALQQENQRKVNEADGLYREGLRLKAQNTEQSLQSAVEKFRAAARITVNSEYRALYQREEAAATAAIPVVREAAAQEQRDRARERNTENKQTAVRVLLEKAQQKITARDIHGAKMKYREAEVELQKGELRYQAGDLLRNQLREQRERILAAERVIAEQLEITARAAFEQAERLYSSGDYGWSAK